LAASHRALERENERLRRENEALRRQIIERDQRIADAEKQAADAEKQIADLERQLASRRQNSTNSSKPPSSDGLAGAPRERGRKKKSKRRPGGQPGHRGAHRPLAPAERVNEIRPVLPAQCQHCGQELPQQVEQVATKGEPHRHQVLELPPIEAHIIEYQCHRVVCSCCGKSTRAELPAEARPQTGPHLTALIGYLIVVCRMPRRVVEALLEQVLGIEMSLGSTQNCWEQASAAVEQPCQQLEQALSQQPVLNVDETGWRTNGDKRYLWAFVAASFAYYTVAKTRGSALLIQILGAVFHGILCSDRFSGYLKYHKGKAQFCWAHLKRNILGILEFTKHKAVEQFCRDVLAQHARLFRLWHKFRDGLIDRPTLLRRSLPIQQKLFFLAERNLDSSDRQVQNLATVLFVHTERLFAFLEYEGVEPTNNSGERALRIGVQWRKVCFGNRSAAGEVATGRLLTVTQTCRLQGKNALIYLADAIRAHRRRQPVPSLLPQ
jgi:transposase